MVEILGGIAVLSIIVIGVVSPLIALFFGKKGFKSAWKIASILLLGFLLLMITPIMVISYYTEEKPLVEKLDRKYESIKDELPKGETTEKILVEIYQSGSKRDKYVNYLINNYNAKDFKGKIVISAFFDGKKVGERAMDLHLYSEDTGYSDYVKSHKLKIENHMWNDLEFKYELQGEFLNEE